MTTNQNSSLWHGFVFLKFKVLADAIPCIRKKVADFFVYTEARKRGSESGAVYKRLRKEKDTFTTYYWPKG